MEYTEYMETLKEQIQNKRARSLVAEEIRGHIEEQAKEYQAEGMSKEDAEREAVRQMGRSGGDRLCLKPDPQTGVSVEIICAGGISDRGIHADITDY